MKLSIARRVQETGKSARPLGRYLIDAGALNSAQLVEALEQQIRIDAPLGEILVAEGLVDADQVMEAVAQQHGLRLVDLTADPPDHALAEIMPPEFWLRHRVVPWRRIGGSLVIATARPDRIETALRDLPAPERNAVAVVSPEPQIMSVIAEKFAQTLARKAETRTSRRFSCRVWQKPGREAPLWPWVCIIALIALFLISPIHGLAAICAISILSLGLITTLKTAAFLAQILANLPETRNAPRKIGAPPVRLPKVSVMVPLFRETEIAGELIKRLTRLTYPKALLEVVFVLEEKDKITRQTLAETQLPPWMRVIEVPDSGSVTTKPRALNYALDFCHGDIIGIWDAEDAPAPDQIDQVVARFLEAPDKVVCLQGILDYYNPRTNWIARCFTIEYASWWRVILPGISKMGMVIPLGGTTLFVRRKQLEQIGGWDAHNVTEDADLGVRLARFGYRTELIPTVTHEEANCRPWPWIKQRSRWLKGFMTTYLVHMRHPGRLLEDLGWWKFLGLQAFFVGTLSQFLFAPVLWSFWMIPFGLPHPLVLVMPTPLIAGFCSLFVMTEAINILIGLVAVSGRDHRFLMPWVPTLTLYFPMGAIASYKALYELATCPYFWDKTKHGQAEPDPLLD